jgi:shikimate kinase/diadenosine tetraphosphatase ApaH/serine/threonine PP2A family protein phosphatase
VKADKLYLVGFMGAGKTSVARALGRRMGWRVEDIDQRIEAREHQRVAEIFARQGEPYFRSVEREILCDLLSERHAIIATGGGTFVDPDNRATMLSDGAVAWLDVPLERVIERVPADGRRPLAGRSRADGAAVCAPPCLIHPGARPHRRVAPRSRNCRAHPGVDWVLRYLVISDVHANLEALDAVLAAADSYDHALVLGDLVGYGADPNAVIDRVRALPAATFIRGNHDKVGAGLENTDGFNYLARHAITWTINTLTAERRQWLAALPQGPVVVDDLVEICHGAPFDEDVYIFDDLDAMRALRVARRPLCLFGHTHVVAGYQVTKEMRSVGDIQDTPIHIPPDGAARFLVNCGAVGQPRDGDPRAAYGIVDTSTQTLSLARVEYDLAAAQAKIVAAGLPEVLAQRLAVGR